MQITCVGGGPAGLYSAILLRQRLPKARVRVIERNRPTDTFGFGVVFSDATLGRLAEADPTSFAAIERAFVRWDSLDISWRGHTLRGGGHGFCGVERKALLRILQARATELGAEITYEAEVDPASIAADVTIWADGVASRARAQHGEQFGATVDERRNRFVWLAAPIALPAFWFGFVETPIGMLRVHAYPYKADASTFIVECTEAAWHAGGFRETDEAHTIATLSPIFADVLGGHKLIGNRSIWRRFPTVRCARWVDGTRVIIGDAAHTAHFSIGSGTKLAMEDSIALVDALAAQPADPSAALRAYEAARRPEVESLQRAAQASLEWFEQTESLRDLSPEEFAYHLFTRSLKVSHESMAKRDQHVADAALASFWRRTGGDPALRPSDAPLVVADLKLPSRIAGRPSGWSIDAAQLRYDTHSVPVVAIQSEADIARITPNQIAWLGGDARLWIRAQWAQAVRARGGIACLVTDAQTSSDMLLISGRADLIALE